MERITAYPFEEVTPTLASRIKLSESAQPVRCPTPSSPSMLPATSRRRGRSAKRIAVRLRWRGRAGEWVRPVRLTSWIDGTEEGHDPPDRPSSRAVLSPRDHDHRAHGRDDLRRRDARALRGHAAGLLMRLNTDSRARLSGRMPRAAGAAASRRRPRLPRQPGSRRADQPPAKPASLALDHRARSHPIAYEVARRRSSASSHGPAKRSGTSPIAARRGRIARFEVRDGSGRTGCWRWS